MQLINDSGAVFTLHSNLGDLIQEMEEKRRSVATLFNNITETTWTDAVSKRFSEHFEEDMQTLMDLYSEMNEKQEAINELGNALKAYEEDITF